MNDHNYALKNAFFYSLLVMLILLAPLYLYYVYTKKIYEIKNELQLRTQANLIIKSMEHFSQSGKKTFTYPRVFENPSGLYDEQFRPVFTLIKKPITNFLVGYHIHEGESTFILKLPSKRYFKASYLIITSTISYLPIYLNIVLILLSIISIIFLLSLFFLNRFAQPFKRVNKKLDNFIKDTMHEVNTPLSIINVNIDLYTMKHKENRYLKRIKAATKTLANVYNDMDFLIKKTQIIFENETIHLSAFLEERIDYFQEVAALKEIHILSDIDCEVYINFNTSKLQRIIDNTLSNAIKYSYEKSSVTVTLKPSNVGSFVMCFIDQGIGIENPKEVLTRYYREDRNKGGFGIGLNIVKAIIDEAGIMLTIESSPKKGSSFCYTIPHEMLLPPGNHPT